MELLLWRHAEAVEASFGQSDLERPLTGRGQKQARRIAEWLREHQPKDLRVLVSPAERCRQTAKALARQYEIEPKLGTSAEVADLLDAASWGKGPATAAEAILLVGHQPTLGCLAAWLLTGQEANWNVKKGALWWFSCDPQAGAGQTVLRAVIGPDLV